MNNLIETAKPRLKRFRESLYLLSRNKLSLLALIILVLKALERLTKERVQKE